MCLCALMCMLWICIGFDRCHAVFTFSERLFVNRSSHLYHLQRGVLLNITGSWVVMRNCVCAIVDVDVWVAGLPLISV